MPVISKNPDDYLEGHSRPFETLAPGKTMVGARADALAQAIVLTTVGVGLGIAVLVHPVDDRGTLSWPWGILLALYFSAIALWGAWVRPDRVEPLPEGMRLRSGRATVRRTLASATLGVGVVAAFLVAVGSSWDGLRYWALVSFAYAVAMWLAWAQIRRLEMATHVRIFRRGGGWGVRTRESRRRFAQPASR